MKVSDFDYDLPESLIAQEPLPSRDASRLLVLDRASGRMEHRVFRDLPEHLRSGDLLVLNDSRVLPARLEGVKPNRAPIEVLLLEPVDEKAASEATQEWRALVRGFPKRSPSFTFPGGVRAQFLSREADGEVARVRVEAQQGVATALRSHGRAPTPPYIKRSQDDPRAPRDRERYQTVYAEVEGAVAAPTAGLHFTPELLESIRARGVTIERLTLHVGWGTFQPVRVSEVEEHRIDPERYSIPESLAEAHGATRRRGGRVVAVGTTVTRALEYAAEGSRLRPGRGRCDSFIYPGHVFRAVDALVTNFHLPESSLLMLVAAFAGRETVLSAYREAIRRGYRFYSYGDAMLIS